MPSTNLSFRTPEELLNKIQRRDPKGLRNPGAVAKRDLERWYIALAHALPTAQLSPAEAVLLIRLVGSAGEPNEALVEELARYIQGSPQDGFHHVQRSLVLKLAAYDQITRWALVDAVEQYEVLIQREPECTLGMALHRVGLHNYRATPEELADLESMQAVSPGELKPIGGDNS